MRASEDHRWGIVLAAGEGTRLRTYVLERTGSNLPKQFATFIGTRSLLRHTLDRLESLLKPRHIATVIHREYQLHAESILTRHEQHSLISVPAYRETGPNVLLAALTIYRSDRDAVILITPSDHFVLEEARFMKYADDALQYVETHPDLVVLLGIHPGSADPDYGWIDLRRSFDRASGDRFYHASAFHEKPGESVAARLRAEGALWNSMVIAAKAETLIGLFRKSAPQMLREMERVMLSSVTPSGKDLDAMFMHLHPLNFSRHVLEQHASRLRILRLDGIHWSDWGTGERVEQSLVSMFR